MQYLYNIKMYIYVDIYIYIYIYCTLGVMQNILINLVNLIINILHSGSYAKYSNYSSKFNN